MFRTGHELEGRVRPLKFQTLDEDAQDERDRASGHPDKVVGDVFGTLRRRLQPPEPNFLLEYAYPAVILEDICFQVDRSQQQANFLRECIFRLNQTLAPLSECVSSSGRSGHSSGDHRLSPKVQILKSVNLSVPCGSIFGLLGPSSCGKTTLLRCLLGLLKPSSGTIRLFGQQKSGPSHRNANAATAVGCAEKLFGYGGPGACASSLNQRWRQRDDHPHCQVPGPGVGYMPQDLGLYEDFTIAQLLTMFGRYMRMESALIEERIKFMASFLELPEVNRKVQTLSGGQKRRVSFAIACLHMPPLIILDEPTVGVDPLLRRSIWRYLRRLASEENKTIIITTHYIEEAAQADQVALMRAGEVLVQDTPRNLMRSNNSATLEEAFLKICNNVGGDLDKLKEDGARQAKSKGESNCRPERSPLQQAQLAGWPAQFRGTAAGPNSCGTDKALERVGAEVVADPVGRCEPASVHELLKLGELAQGKFALHDRLGWSQLPERQLRPTARSCGRPGNQTSTRSDELSDGAPMIACVAHDCRPTRGVNELLEGTSFDRDHRMCAPSKRGKSFLPKRNKFTLNSRETSHFRPHEFQTTTTPASNKRRAAWRTRTRASLGLYWALLYKNYRRNVNSIPLLVFQFMLPMIQMISFCLCVGGRPTNIGLGIVNHDQPSPALGGPSSAGPSYNLSSHEFGLETEAPLSWRYLSFLDRSMLAPRPYGSLSSALADVRRAKLWAVLEIGQNFTSAIERRFDLDNFYQLDADTIGQSIIRVYPDRSNKILDMICHRSLVDSFRAFLSSEFEHFKRLPIEMAKPIFEITPNVISNSIDGYTESIAPGLLASLTYIMAAGLTTFIMVVERSDGILERTYTSGINPISYLVAHAVFRSLVMMIQIALVLVLTFYVLKQPIVGSIWLAYAMLMVLNITGISYGLLISSIVTDQNGAALTIVSSLVVKITLSGILWPFEAIPRWLRTICYVQPLTMPVQALKSITLKGAALGDASVNLGFLVSITWLIVFLTISARRFKFYQH